MKKRHEKRFLKIIAVLAVIAGALLLFYPLNKEKNEVWTVQVMEGVTAPVAGVEKAPYPKETKTEEETTITAIPIQPGADRILPEGKKPRIAIVIDDMGLKIPASKKAIALPPSVTLSFLPCTQQGTDLAEQAKAAGHELLLHMPMEPLGKEDPGPDALLTGQTPEEIRARLEKAFGCFTGYDGINNHMGSKFTANREGMDVVMGILKERKLFFLDSATTSKSIAAEAAKAQQIPFAKRDVFLDNNTSIAAVKAKLSETEKIARKNGQAIALGHPNLVLISALEKWIPEAEKNGFQIVPVRDLVQQ